MCVCVKRRLQMRIFNFFFFFFYKKKQKKKLSTIRHARTSYNHTLSMENTHRTCIQKSMLVQFYFQRHINVIRMTCSLLFIISMTVVFFFFFCFFLIFHPTPKRKKTKTKKLKLQHLLIFFLRSFLFFAFFFFDPTIKLA